MKKLLNKVLTILIAVSFLATSIAPAGVSALAAKHEDNQNPQTAKIENKLHEKVKEKRSIRNFSERDRQKIEQAIAIATDNGAEAAEIVNEFVPNEEDLGIAVREVLDTYYSEETLKEEELAAFCEELDDSVQEIIENYAEAAEERANAEELDYETEKVLLSFAPGTPIEDIEMSVMNEAVSYELIHDGEAHFADDLPEEDRERMEAVGVEDRTILVLAQIRLEDTVERAAKKFDAVDCVVAAEDNTYFEFDGETTPNDSAFTDGLQWNLDRVYIKSAWAQVRSAPKPATPIKIAVIDCGADMDHKELENTLSRTKSVDVTLTGRGSDYYKGYRLLAECDREKGGQWAAKLENHGTACAGVIIAEADNGRNGLGAVTMGLKPTEVKEYYEVMMVKASMSEEPEGRWTIISKAHMASAIRYAIGEEVDVISMSNGKKRSAFSANGFSILKDEIDDAKDAGIVLVVAAGNNANADEERFPAAFTTTTDVGGDKLDNVISVGGTDREIKNGENTYKDIAWVAENPGPNDPKGSNWGKYVDIVAPANNVYVLHVNDGDYSEGKGTSFATPLVASTVAMMRCVNPNLTPKQIKEILVSTSTVTISYGNDKKTKHPMLNAAEAVKAARTGIFPPYVAIETNGTYERKRTCPSNTNVMIRALAKGKGETYYSVDGKKFKKINSGTSKKISLKASKGDKKKTTKKEIRAYNKVNGTKSTTVKKTYTIVHNPTAPNNVIKTTTRSGTTIKKITFKLKIPNLTKPFQFYVGKQQENPKWTERAAASFKIQNKKNIGRYNEAGHIFVRNVVNGVASKFVRIKLKEATTTIPRSLVMRFSTVGEEPDEETEEALDFEDEFEILDSPDFSKETGTYAASSAHPLSITIDNTKSYTITKYTTNGTDPIVNGTLYYGQAFQFNTAGTTTIRAVNARYDEDGELEYSEETEEEYIIVTPPTISLASGTYSGTQYTTLGNLQGDTYYSTDYGYTWKLYEEGQQIPIKAYTKLLAVNEVDGVRSDEAEEASRTYAIIEKKMGAFGAGFMTNAYENPQSWANVLPIVFPNTNLVADQNEQKDLVELVDNSHFVEVQEMSPTRTNWKNYDQLPGSVFMDNFNNAYISGMVTNLKSAPALINAATSGPVTTINGAWDDSTVNSAGAADAEKLKITGGNFTLNGDYPSLTEIRIESQGGTQLLGNYPNLEYIYMISNANLNLVGNFPSLKGVYMPGGQLLLGTADCSFNTTGANIINETGSITVYAAQETQILSSNIVTNGKIAIRGAGAQAPD